MKEAGTKSGQLKALRHRAEALLHEKPQALSNIPPEDIQQLIHELQVYQIKLEMQNEELRRVQLQLGQARDKYSDLYDLAPVGYFFLDKDALVLEANLTGANLLSVERRSLINSSFTRFIAPDCQDSFYLHGRRVFETEARQTCELKLLKNDGSEFYGLLDSIAVPDAEGNVKQFRTAITDIAKRRQALEKLKASEEKYRTLVDNITIGVAHISPNMEILTINNQMRKWFPDIKLDKKPLCYQTFNDPPGEGVCTYCPTIQTLQDGQVHESLTETPAGDEIRHFRIVSSPIKDKKGKVVAGIEMVEDVTDRMRMEKALRDSERRFKSIFENAPIGFYRTTLDGRILDANPALLQILGYASFEELATVNLQAHDYHPDYSRRQFKERIERDGQIMGVEALWKRQDGTIRHIRENARIVRDANDKIVCYEGTIEDITEQKQAADQIRDLSQQLIKAQEDERQMISRELHDRVAQDLSTLLIGLDTIFKHQPNVIPEVRNRALEFSEILQGTIGAVRDLSYDLLLPGLDDMGLIPALSMYCEEFAEKSGQKVEFQATGMSTLRLDFDTEMNLYRLIQEGLNNIRKHAAAKQATVKLVGTYPNIILRIEDDGKGFDLEERARTAGTEKRMGLRSMAERVRLIRGEMQIRSQPGKGTRIFVKFPYQEKRDD